MSAVQPARRVAYETLRAVHESDAYANLLLPRAIARAGLSTQDAALATELTYGTLRRQGTYDAIITEASSRNVHEIDPPVLDALRLAVHQLLHTRVASHAAVNESVSLAREAVGNSATGFTNAVLRRVARETPGEWMSRIDAAARSDDERLGLHTAHPVWIVRAFRRALAAEGRADELDALLAADNVSPGVTMAALPGLSESPDGAQRTPYSPIGFRLGGGDPDPVVRASEGRVRVQDEGSQLAALALTRATAVREGERWLDLCAGPGGKTAVLAAEALAGGAVLEANEIMPARAGLVRAAIAGVPLTVEVSEEDGRDRARRALGRYDRILVDAPCTGLGALRRRPEARWRKTPSDVPDLARLQAGLVDAALKALAPGGIVAYVTCSPHLAETSAVVADARRAWGDRIEELDARAVLEGLSESPLDLPAPADGSGRAQLWPHRHGTDAMFISLLRRV
ncbi:RsmB/NOP family class I SAM-dependent RNA methyltransferase [Micromonospora sp. DT81.3]|uniref:RsmB/NOP family class I SAM-dependent RNA methyltransferase n=1 Tax=Micromonospora sp. DT81.3 TaxID=3416523 RepID=UPI003CF6C2ED